MRQRAAQPQRLDPHDRIGLGVEAVGAPERPGADGVALEPSGASRKRGLDHEAQKAGQAPAGPEAGAGDDLLKCGAHIAGFGVVGMRGPLGHVGTLMLAIRHMPLIVELQMLSYF